MTIEPKPTEPFKCPKCGSTNVHGDEESFYCEDCRCNNFPDLIDPLPCPKCGSRNTVGLHGEHGIECLDCKHKEVFDSPE
jgi:hypothetical protein